MAIILKKSIASRLFSTLLFFGCGVFVAFRGYDCFNKYWKKPIHVEFKYVNGEDKQVLFPALTFCKNKGEDLSIKELKEGILGMCKTIEFLYFDDSRYPSFFF